MWSNLSVKLLDHSGGKKSTKCNVFAALSSQPFCGEEGADFVVVVVYKREVTV